MKITAKGVPGIEIITNEGQEFTQLNSFSGKLEIDTDGESLDINYLLSKITSAIVGLNHASNNSVILKTTNSNKMGTIRDC